MSLYNFLFRLKHRESSRPPNIVCILCMWSKTQWLVVVIEWWKFSSEKAVFIFLLTSLVGVHKYCYFKMKWTLFTNMIHQMMTTTTNVQTQGRTSYLANGHMSKHMLIGGINALPYFSHIPTVHIWNLIQVSSRMQISWDS